jgi:hypothetical protein
MADRGEQDAGRHHPKRPTRAGETGGEARPPEARAFSGQGWKTRAGWNDAAETKGFGRHGPGGQAHQHTHTYKEHHRGGRKR